MWRIYCWMANRVTYSYGICYKFMHRHRSSFTLSFPILYSDNIFFQFLLSLVYFIIYICTVIINFIAPFYLFILLFLLLLIDYFATLYWLWVYTWILYPIKQNDWQSHFESHFYLFTFHFSQSTFQFEIVAIKLYGVQINVIYFHFFLICRIEVPN